MYRFLSFLLVFIFTVGNVSFVYAVPGAHKVLSLTADINEIYPADGESVTLSFQTQGSTGSGKVSLIIYDQNDEEIVALIRDKKEGGGIRTHTAVWDGKDAQGNIYVGSARVEASYLDVEINKIKHLYVQVKSGSRGFVSDEETPIPTGEEDAIGDEIVKNFCGGFDDVPRAHVYCEAIGFMKQKGIMSGDAGKNTFRPGESLNRAETAKILATLFVQTLGAGDKPSGNLGHRDIISGSWYVEFIFIAKKYGVLQGDPSGTMRPGDNVNRAEFAKMFFRAAKTDLSPYGAVSFYGDVEVNDWFAAEANAARSYDLIEARDLYFPHKAMTRGEVAKWIYTFYKKNLWSNSEHI